MCASGSSNSGGGRGSGTAVLEVLASGFELGQNFKFTYEPSTGIINQCIEGGLAEHHQLLGWKITSFKLPAKMNQIRIEDGGTLAADHSLHDYAKRLLGKKVPFSGGIEEHKQIIRQLRPLTLFFEEAEAAPPPPPLSGGYLPGGGSSDQQVLEAQLARWREEAELRKAIEAS